MKRQVGLALMMAGFAISMGSVPVAAQKKDRYLITVEEMKEREDLTTPSAPVAQNRPRSG